LVLLWFFHRIFGGKKENLGVYFNFAHYSITLAP
jgi:hypothetical protein